MKSEDERNSAGSARAGRAGEADGLFRLLVQNVLDYAIFMLDADGRVTAWNEGAKRLKGYAAEEIIGQPFSTFFTPEDQRVGKPQYEKGMADAHGRYEGEGWRVRKNGSRFWGNEILTAIRDAEGRVTGYTKIARDLTERKRMEDTLREREERIRMMVDNIRDYAVFVMDPDGAIASWNPGAQRLFGYEESEIVGRPGQVLFTAEDVAAGEHARELATALAEGRASDDRWQVRKGGQRFWASGVTHAIRDADGALRGYAKVCRDLTERKQMEEQRERLLEQEKLARLEAEQSMAQRDQFLAVVSHELRTPLTAILLWVKLLRSGTVKEHEWAGALATVEQSAEAQRQLIEDLLDMSGITSGKMRLDVREADLAVVVRSAVKAVRPMSEAKGVPVEVSLDAGAGWMVRCDPDRIQQVVWNLVNNAVKFTPRGGAVRVRVDRLEASVRVVVSDTGQGIPAAFLPHVFEVFRQADVGMTRAQGGLGLGLSICKTLVELHGGTIGASSAGEGRGATFTVDLPLAVAGVTAQAEGPGPTITEGDSPAAAGAQVAAVHSVRTAGGELFVPGPVLAGVRVLVVEDDASAREVVRWLLGRCGAEVTAVESASAAVEAFRGTMSDGGYDVVVSDIAMPGQDGYELVGAIRALEREKEGGGGRGGSRVVPVPAVALTAHARDVDRGRAAAAGFDAHVPKPVEPAVLVATVARLVGRVAGG